MRLESKKYLFDILQAAKNLQQFSQDIAEFERIISFRNILIHGYAEIDDRLVWDILRSKLPLLLEQVQSLLDDG